MVDLAQEIAVRLPYLRRYARALTGSQASGDAYVAAMLEALLQDPALLEEKLGPRVGLFYVFRAAGGALYEWPHDVQIAFEGPRRKWTKILLRCRCHIASKPHHGLHPDCIAIVVKVIDRIGP